VGHHRAALLVINKQITNETEKRTSKEGRFTPAGSKSQRSLIETSGGKPPFLTCSFRDLFFLSECSELREFQEAHGVNGYGSGWITTQFSR